MTYPTEPGTYDITDAGYPYAVLGKLHCDRAIAESVLVSAHSVGRDPRISTLVHVGYSELQGDICRTVLDDLLRALGLTLSEVHIQPEEGA